jgi:hypothetical protein
MRIKILFVFLVSAMFKTFLFHLNFLDFLTSRKVCKRENLVLEINVTLSVFVRRVLRMRFTVKVVPS